MNQILIKKLREDAIIPARITEGSAAYDAMLPCDVELTYGRQIIPLGFAIAMPPTLGLDDRTRAGYAAKGLKAYDEFGKDRDAEGNEYRLDADVILGLIDSDYRNEVGVILHVRDERVKAQRFFLHREQAVSQLKFCVVPETVFVEVGELDETARIGGFGKQNNE